LFDVAWKIDNLLINYRSSLVLGECLTLTSKYDAWQYQIFHLQQ